MSVQDISPDLDKLEAQLDKVEATIKPLLENISNSTQLPLVDRAKLFTLTNYALESLLFCKRIPLSLSDIILTISS
jgi:exosome complex protein LRP1